MRLLRAADRIATPWKNGGGVTTEVVAFPERATLEDFGWRVSIAEVRRGGPFSVFPGVDRHLAVLAGRLQLNVGHRPPIEITPSSAPVTFPGDVATSAEPLAGPVFDLNLMTRRSQFVARMARSTLVQPATLTLSAHVSVLIPLSRLIATQSATSLELGERDALILLGHHEIRITSHTENVELIVISIDGG